ncbi:hypothetical protein SAMN06265349_106246 [Flavobacterium resistens]|uniref:WG containing repeat-containing protein n=1 Tax=Flavobacterium resistens TaxID=443612 RepID=A0A521F4J3_9FLAO|nr:hypothetical protein [Flavobacterium resistens]MRX69543.1 hypothetical protein [Flavobacterium resistens]SMO90946.1 hypothetical protein SAMN06265349_106246 [Flavobacterium resistens]
MKKVVLLILMVKSFFSFSQDLQKTGEIKIINRYLSILKTQNGYVFIGPEGEKSEEYDYLYMPDNNCRITAILKKTDSNQSRLKQKKDNDNHGIQGDFHILELMKELHFIDEYNFEGTNELTNGNIRSGLTEEYGYASRNGKYALINSKGKFLTDLKYTNDFDYRENPHLNYYFEKKKLVSVLIDQITGKEVLATKDSIVEYWNPNNYLVKKYKKEKYILVHDGKIQPVPKDFKRLNGIPLSKSTIFTYNNGFFDKNGHKIESDFVPHSNFYNGHCIVLEIIKEKQRYNYYGEPFPRRETRSFKIINENFEIVKSLPDIQRTISSFNKYGQIIVNRRYEDIRNGDTDNQYIIDYNGDIILPSSKIRTEIYEVSEGLYLAEDATYPPVKERSKLYTYFNQKGENITKAITQLPIYLGFKENTVQKYLVAYGIIYLTLDKENNIISSDQKSYLFDAPPVLPYE